jgi:hypothetical protein
MGNISQYLHSEKGYRVLPCPRLIFEYNKHMGGVDLLDNKEMNYAITTRLGIRTSTGTNVPSKY